MSDGNYNSGGIGFVGLLTIVLITLKLTHVIDWSWWWVWSPVIFSWTLVLIVVIMALVFCLVAAIRND